MKLSEGLKEWIKSLAIAIGLALLILFFFKPTIVKEQSMQNTLHNNDYVFVSRQSYTIFGEPQRGDIIVFHSRLTTANGSEKLLVKRIIGLPGDTLAIHDGSVILNGEVLEEDYTAEGYTASEMDEMTVPENKLFVMGDNRQNSADSRMKSVGLVDYSEVVGKVVFRLFPFSSIGRVH